MNTASANAISACEGEGGAATTTPTANTLAMAAATVPHRGGELYRVRLAALTPRLPCKEGNTHG